MAKDFTGRQTLQLVTNLTRVLPNLPTLLIDRVAEVAVNLYDGLLDQFSATNYINCIWLVADVVERFTLGKMNFLREVIKVDHIDTIPGLEKWQRSEEFKAFLPLQDRMRVKNLLIVLL